MACQKDDSIISLSRCQRKTAVAFLDFSPVGRESVIGCNFGLRLHLASLDADFDDGSRLELVHKIDLCMRVLKTSTYFLDHDPKHEQVRNTFRTAHVRDLVSPSVVLCVRVLNSAESDSLSGPPCLFCRDRVQKIPCPDPMHRLNSVLRYPSRSCHIFTSNPVQQNQSSSMILRLLSSRHRCLCSNGRAHAIV